MNQITLKYGNGDVSFNAYMVPKSEIEQKKLIFIEKNSKNALFCTQFLYLVFDSKVTAPFQYEIFTKYDLTISEKLDHCSYILYSKQLNTVSLCYDLQQIPSIEIAEPDFKFHHSNYEFVRPTDDLLDFQWYLENKGKDLLGKEDWKYKKGADAKIIEAWKLLEGITGKLGSDTITIAVLDKGFDLDHPDFKGKLVAPKDFSPFGFSEPFKIFQSGQSPDPNVTFTNADHGTACAGIALASSNGAGIVGVAPNAKLLPIIYNTAGGRDLRRMFRHIMKNGGDVISCSFGTLGQPMDSLAIRAIKECATLGRNGKGCVIVFATGNHYSFLSNNELATHPNVIAVGASTSEDTFAPYTDQTTNMSVVAPGGWGHTGTMATTDPGHYIKNGQLVPIGKGPIQDGQINFVDHHHFYRFNAEGTSFACPLVAGVAALILSANPNLSAQEVKSIIEQTADKIGDANEYKNGHSTKFGYGRVNAANAVRAAFNMNQQLYAPSKLPDYSFVKPLNHNYGFDMNGDILMHQSFALFKFTAKPEQIGKRLEMSLSVPVDHDMTKLLTVFVKHNDEPTHFTGGHDIQAQITDDMFIEFAVDTIFPGDYFVKVMCLSKLDFNWINGGGQFTLNFTVIHNIFSPRGPIASIDFEVGDIVQV